MPADQRARPARSRRAGALAPGGAGLLQFGDAQRKRSDRPIGFAGALRDHHEHLLPGRQRVQPLSPAARRSAISADAGAGASRSSKSDPEGSETVVVNHSTHTTRASMVAGSSGW